MTPSNPPLTGLPSMRKLAVTTGAAMATALLVLVVFVLPAEYGIDPFHTGAALGLTALSAPPTKGEGPPPGATMFKPVIEGPLGYYAAPYKTDTADFDLGPYEYLEYKYWLEKDANMVYSWTATAGVKHDLHGKPDGEGREEQSFDKKPRQEGHGDYRAPFTGIHGWFWENPGPETIRIRIHTAGFYASAVEFRSDRTRRAHPLTALPSNTKNP